MLTKLEFQQECDTIIYAHSAAVVVGTPIYVSGLGVLIPTVSAAINVAIAYYTKGVYKADITTAETVEQFDPVYYVISTGKVTKTDPGSVLGFLLGIAVNAGTGTAGTVDVEIQKPISVEHLDSGIRPSHVIKYCAEVNAGGTQTTETIAVSGVSSLDKAFAEISVDGADTTAYVRVAKAYDGGITAKLNTPTGSGGKITYHVVRAVA